MSSSNWCFLTCIQISQEASQVVWYSHLFQNFPQVIVIRTVKGFGIVNKAEIDVFLELSCFFHDPADLAIWSLVPLPFLKPAWTSGSSRFAYSWSLAWRILSITLLACRWVQLCGSLSILWRCLSLGLVYYKRMWLRNSQVEEMRWTRCEEKHRASVFSLGVSLTPDRHMLTNPKACPSGY